MQKSPPQRAFPLDTAISDLPIEVLAYIFQIVLRLGNPPPNSQVSGEIVRRNLLGLREVCWLFKRATGMAFQSEWGEIQTVAERRLQLPQRMVHIETSFSEVPKELATRHCDFQAVLLRMHWFKQLALQANAIAKEREHVLEEEDLISLALESKMQSKKKL